MVTLFSLSPHPRCSSSCQIFAAGKSLQSTAGCLSFHFSGETEENGGSLNSTNKTFALDAIDRVSASSTLHQIKWVWSQTMLEVHGGGTFVLHRSEQRELGGALGFAQVTNMYFSESNPTILISGLIYLLVSLRFEWRALPVQHVCFEGMSGSVCVCLGHQIRAWLITIPISPLAASALDALLHKPLHGACSPTAPCDRDNRPFWNLCNPPCFLLTLQLRPHCPPSLSLSPPPAEAPFFWSNQSQFASRNVLPLGSSAHCSSLQMTASVSLLITASKQPSGRLWRFVSLFVAPDWKHSHLVKHDFPPQIYTVLIEGAFGKKHEHFCLPT